MSSMSDSPSVCLFVTRWYTVQTNKRKIMQFSSSAGTGTPFLVTEQIHRCTTVHQQSKAVKVLFQQKFQTYGTRKSSNTKGNGHAAWTAVNRLLHPHSVLQSTLTADDFTAHFQHKIATICQSTASALSPVTDSRSVASYWCLMTWWRKFMTCYLVCQQSTAA